MRAVVDRILERKACMQYSVSCWQGQGRRLWLVLKGGVLCVVRSGGKLVTLFSAPCYPMFTAPEDEPFRNQAAVLHLTAPDYATPDVQHFEALMPRPPVSICLL
jgi:hypothetical protein